MNMHAKTLFAAAMLSLSCLAAQAQEMTSDASPAPQADAQTAPPARAEVNCVRYTGSLVLAAQARRDERRARATGTTAAQPPCNGSPGQGYSREDIQRTGAIDLADALRKLDPAIH